MAPETCAVGEPAIADWSAHSLLFLGSFEGEHAHPANTEDCSCAADAQNTTYTPDTENTSGATDTEDTACAADAQDTASAQKAPDAQKAANTIDAEKRGDAPAFLAVFNGFGVSLLHAIAKKL